MTTRFLMWLAIVSGVLAAMFFLKLAQADAAYVRRYSCHWRLAEKASTISAKEEKIKAFVEALEKGREEQDFSDNDAMFFPTPDNAFSNNLEAVKTLAQRLGEIRAMDPKSFEYNTAIQQITAQEQGEAHRMMRVFDGCWTLRNYPLLWGWIGGILSVGMPIVFIFSLVGIVISMADDDWKKKHPRGY